MTYEGEVTKVERQEVDDKQVDTHTVKIRITTGLYPNIGDFYNVVLPGKAELGTKYAVTFEKQFGQAVTECSEAVDKVMQ